MELYLIHSKVKKKKVVSRRGKYKEYEYLKFNLTILQFCKFLCSLAYSYWYLEKKDMFH